MEVEFRTPHLTIQVVAEVAVKVRLQIFHCDLNPRFRGAAKSFKESACQTENLIDSPNESSALDSTAVGVTVIPLDERPQGSSALGLGAAGTALPCPMQVDVTRGPIRIKDQK